MSNKLKKKSKEKRRIEKFLEVNKTSAEVFKQEKKEDNAIMTVSGSCCYMTYLALLDVLGFKEKRLKKFYSLVQALKNKWAVNVITTQGMLNYCKKKNIMVEEWLRSIPNNQKIALCPITIATKEGMKCVDAAVMASGLFCVIVLKEHFKVSLKNIHMVLEHIKNSISCYATKQPVSKKPYLTDKDILDVFRTELKLDLVTGEKVV